MYKKIKPLIGFVMILIFPVGAIIALFCYAFGTKVILTTIGVVVLCAVWIMVANHLLDQCRVDR